MEMKVIAHIRSDFPTKFGIPHQSGRIQELKADIIFEPEYRNHEAFRGLEEYTHIWLIWEFSEAVRTDWSPTVRPPRLGGNTRLGVFATRSPFRPNPIGLSCVCLESVEKTERDGTVLVVSGADLMDGTPIFDIKPYLPYADAQPEATGGFTADAGDFLLQVELPAALEAKIPAPHRAALRGVLSHDPRPSYQADSGRVYAMRFLEFDVRFTVEGGVLTVCGVERV